MPTYIYAFFALLTALHLVFGAGAAPVWAAATDESEINASAEAPVEEAGHQAKGTVIIQLRVPHMEKRTDEFSINPYTTKPPPIAIPIAMLPENKPGLRQKILSTGYGQRLSLTKAYPEGGWRWQYVYRKARAKSGIGEPHMFFQMNGFAEDMMPYVLPEAKRSNKIEFQRLEKYNALVTEYTDNHKDEEMEALRLGHEKIKLNLTAAKNNTILKTSLFVSPGDWWITGSHKVPGLVYFWQYPIKVHDNETLNIELNEENALLVQGGW